jgi:hypothetical protein
MTNGVMPNSDFSSNHSATTLNGVDPTAQETADEESFNEGSSVYDYTDIAEIDNICDSLSSQLSSKAESFNLLGRIRSHNRPSFQLYNALPQPNQLVSPNRPSHYDILKIPKSSIRAELARRAVICYLQVISTSWATSELQDNEGIFFHQDISSTRPFELGIYLSHTFLAGESNSSRSNSSRSNNLPHLTNPTLYKLSLLLIELCLQRKMDDPRNPEKSFKKAHSLVKKNTTCKIQYKFGRPYKAAVRFCLHSATAPKCGEDLPQKFRREVYEKIAETCRHLKTQEQ